MICKLFLWVPLPDGTWGWMSKEEGGSDEGMTKKVGGQQVEDADNSFKSEFTNAFRRTAQDAWGIGRYLYQKGIPLFLDPSIPAEAICGQEQAPPFQQAPAPVASSAAIATEAHAQAHEAMAAHGQAERAKLAEPTTVERIDMPPAGRDVYPWVRNMEQRFKTNLLNGVKQGATSRGLNPTQLYAWPEAAVAEICGEAVAFIKTLPTYRGEFEHIAPGAPAPVAQPTEPPPPTATAPPNTGDPLAAAKKELMTKIAAHIERQLGVKPTNEQLKAAFQTVASECQTGAGHVGEVPDSLKDLTDRVWIGNMIDLVDENLKKPPAAQADGSGEIPF